MIMIANLQYAWTLFVGPLQEANAWKLADVQWAFSLFILLQTWVQPLDGWLIDRMGPRALLTVAGVLCGIGWTAMGRATSLPQLYFFYAIAGIGAAFVYSGSVGSALKWFPTRRGMAAGIIAAGFGGGTALFIPLISYLIRTQTYRGAFLVTGILQGAVIAIVSQFLRHPGKDFVPARATSTASVARARRNTESFTTPEMLRTSHFYMLYLMFVTMATGGLLATAQNGPIVKAWGFPASTLVMVAFLSPLANGASRIFWGWATDRTGRELGMGVAFLLQAVCLVLVPTVGRTSPTLFLVTMVLVFFTWGEVFSLFPSTNGDYFGSPHATSNYGMLYSAKGVSAIIGGGIAAWLFQQFGSWSALFYGSAAMALISGVMAFVLRGMPLPAKSPALVREPVAVRAQQGV